jgi:hypothetical protein
MEAAHGMNQPQSAAEQGKEFPYTSKVTCYIEVGPDGAVTWGVPDEQTLERARTGTSQLFALWPGQWSSHLFAIDDLDECARALGFQHDESRTGLADHDHDVTGP